MALQDYKFQYFLIDLPVPFVAHVQINRPEKLNTWHREVWLEFHQLFNRLSSDPEVRAVVLSGAGDRAFTAGLDLTAASASIAPQEGADPGRAAAALSRTIDEFQAAVTSMDKCNKPVICVLHGFSLGLAIDLATAADVRICSKNTHFSVKEVDVGMAADVGTLSRLPRVVGSLSWVKDVCYSARDFFADEALAVGLVSQVHPTKAAALDAAFQMAAFWATKSPVAVQGTKELLNHARDHTIDDNLRYTSVWNSAMLQSTDFKTAIISRLQKTTPRFAKL